MSFSGSINNILEDTIQRFFTESYHDSSLNYLREWVNTPNFENIRREEDEDTDSIPDLILGIVVQCYI